MGKRKEPDEVLAGRAKIEAAQEVIQRAVEGGLLQDLLADKRRRPYWSDLQHSRSAECARRFRSLVEGMGVRVFCEQRRKAHNGIHLHVDVPGGHLTAHPTGGPARWAEG